MRWPSTTHDWESAVDPAHLAEIRDLAPGYAPGGALHLLLEAVAYPEDEARHNGRGACTVTLHLDGSVTVTDDGRGTDTRYDDGVPVRKPVMATKDLRFFDSPVAPTLPDGHPRRGMSVVAALSSWLVHTNRRPEGAWTQRYEHGVPVTDLLPVREHGTTGTTVSFMPDPALVSPLTVSASDLRRLLDLPPLTVEVRDERRAGEEMPGSG